MNQTDKEFKSIPFYIKVSGRLALFTDPSTKGGGEKFTYQVPTYEALKGIIKSIYWKPTIEWVVDSVKIMNPIQMETMGVRTMHDETNPDKRQDRSYYTYLRKPEYLIKCHFVWSDIDSMAKDRNKIKHTDIMKKAIERGGRKPVFLGTTECSGYVESITEDEYETATTPYQNMEMSLGLMFHSFDYHDNPGDDFKGLETRFALVTLSNGEIVFPEEEDMQFVVHKVNDRWIRRQYVLGENTMSVDDEYTTLFKGDE